MKFFLTSVYGGTASRYLKALKGSKLRDKVEIVPGYYEYASPDNDASKGCIATVKDSWEGKQEVCPMLTIDLNGIDELMLLKKTLDEDLIICSDMPSGLNVKKGKWEDLPKPLRNNPTIKVYDFYVE